MKIKKIGRILTQFHAHIGLILKLLLHATESAPHPLTASGVACNDLPRFVTAMALIQTEKDI